METLSDIEREVVVLQAVVESIQSMVNNEMMQFSAGDSETQVTFTSLAQGALFNVLLADFLERVDPALLGAEGSLLDALETSVATACFDKGDSAERLQAAAATLRAWFDEQIEVEVWFPSIEKEVDLKLQRRDFVSICGNISKHNVSRLTGKAKALQRLLKANGVSVSWTDALRALDDFHGRFHDDILIYHTTTLAELLNNVRWAIHEYLKAEYDRSYKPPKSEDDPRYSFTYPVGVSNEYAKARYWDLMNSVRGKPWIRRFTGSKFLKGRY